MDIYGDDIFTALNGEFAEFNPLLAGHDLAQDITALHPQLAVCHRDRQRIRDVVRGEQAVKLKREVYLPRSRDKQSDDEYARILEHTVFFPATGRTAKGIMGLMTARNVRLDAPALDPIRDAITNELASVEDMAGDVIWDTLQTNFTGLLVDFPDAPASNARDAVSQGRRPFLHVFPAETILWIDYHLDGGARLPSRIVVRETWNRVLELRVDAGVYWQRVWEQENGAQYAVKAMARPTVAGKPLSRIPWVTVSDNTHPYPQDSVLRDIAHLNLAHYKAESMVANLAIYGSAVVPYVSGITLDRDPATNLPLQPRITIATGGVIIIEDAQGRAGYMEPAGNQATHLHDRAVEISNMMAKVGSRVLASEKPAPENENVVLLRNMGEDANVATLADVYARRISEALSWAAWWINPQGQAFRGDEARFVLNTEFKNDNMDGRLLTAWTAAFQAAAISHQTYLEGLQDAGRVRSELSIPDEIGRVQQDIADRPPVTAAPANGPVN